MGKNYICTLEHRGEKFRMHGITSAVVNSMFSCNVCKKKFALDAVVALLNYYIDNRSPCRDITCCQQVGTPSLTAYLPAAIEQNTGHAAPTPKHMLQSDEPNAEREVPAVCRWCKGDREITINFKTKPCDCVKGETVRDGSAMAHLVNSGDIGRGWKVKKTFTVG